MLIRRTFFAFRHVNRAVPRFSSAEIDLCAPLALNTISEGLRAFFEGSFDSWLSDLASSILEDRLLPESPRSTTRDALRDFEVRFFLGMTPERDPRSSGFL